METIQYTQEHFARDIQSLAEKISGSEKKFDLIVGVNRGGAIPAVCLSHKLKLPATMIDWSTRDGTNITPKNLYGYFEDISYRYNKILIVDDLVDSGVSIVKLINTATLFCDVSVATLLHNSDVNLTVDHYWGTVYSRQTEKRYFDFWWEVM